MDPISAIGIGAGAAQFADVGLRGLLNSVRLLKRVKKAPKYVSELLRDVEETIQHHQTLRAALQQPSPIFQSLPGQQSASLRSRVDRVYEAALDLQQSLCTLAPGCSNANEQWTRKTWRAIMTVVKEDEVTARIERLQRLHMEAMSELQLLGLDKQATGL